MQVVNISSRKQLNSEVNIDKFVKILNKMASTTTYDESSHILKTKPGGSSEGGVSTISGNSTANSEPDSPFSQNSSARGSLNQDTSNLVEAERRRRSGDENLASTGNLNHIGLNYINSILGSGIVGIPYALHKAGFGFGLFLLIALAVVTDYSLSLLVKSANLAGVTSYQDLVHVAFGRPGFYLLTLLQFIYPFIAMISYNIVIGDTVTKVFKRVFQCKSTFFTNSNL